jgi:hypothetical protein
MPRRERRMLAAMRVPGGVMRFAVGGAVLGVAIAASGSLGGADAVEPVAPNRIAYVTSRERQPESKVWSARANGSEPRQLGPGDQPLMSPQGASVAAGLFGSGPEKGPSLVLYSSTGGVDSTFGDLTRQSAVPLAWSPDSRYLAVMLVSTAVKGFVKKSGLAILDTTTGSLRTIATGIIYGGSFAPDGSDRIVFGRALGQSLSAKVNLYMSQATGAGLRRLTGDGRSLNPVWGSKFIAYDRERLRRNDAPVYQLWLRRASGGAARRLTSIRVRSLVSGLTPTGFSSDGTRLLAEFVGQDTSEAWTVQVPSGRARPVRVKRLPVVGAAISKDGSRLLVYEGGLEGPAEGDSVVTVPFSGGAPTLLAAHAAQPSWNE